MSDEQESKLKQSQEVAIVARLVAEPEEMKSREEKGIGEPQILQQQRQTSTDQSNEISIGNKTAEDLVGDILASDPNDEDLDLMLTKSIATRTNNGLTTNDEVERSSDVIQRSYDKDGVNPLTDYSYPFS